MAPVSTYPRLVSTADSYALGRSVCLACSECSGARPVPAFGHSGARCPPLPNHSGAQLLWNSALLSSPPISSLPRSTNICTRLLWQPLSKFVFGVSGAQSKALGPSSCHDSLLWHLYLLACVFDSGGGQSGTRLASPALGLTVVSALDYFGCSATVLALSH